MNNTNQTDATVLTPVQQAIAAAQAGNKPLARLHLENAVTSEHQNPTYWVWLAWTAESPTSTISALQHALSLDPQHKLAQQGLDWALAMREFDLYAYGPSDSAQATVTPTVDEPATEPTQPAPPQPAATEPIDEGITGDDFELPEEAFFETPAEKAEQVEQPAEPAPTPAPEEAQSVEEPVIEIEEVGEPVVAETTDEIETADELEADIETFEDTSVEPSKVQDDVSETTDTAETDAEPLEAELVDVSDIDPEDLVADDAGESHESSADGPVTVLAVDDSPTIRKIVSMSLESVGYQVVTAADGMEAMQKLPKCNPSLILTDISMPKLDGYQLCKLIKAHEKTKTIPVIMLSGKDGMFDKIKGKFVGCDDYITKPFQSSELLEKVSSYLPTPVSDS